MEQKRVRTTWSSWRLRRVRTYPGAMITLTLPASKQTSIVSARQTIDQTQGVLHHYSKRTLLLRTTLRYVAKDV